MSDQLARDKYHHLCRRHAVLQAQIGGLRALVDEARQAEHRQSAALGHALECEPVAGALSVADVLEMSDDALKLMLVPIDDVERLRVAQTDLAFYGDARSALDAQALPLGQLVRRLERTVRGEVERLAVGGPQ